MNKLPNAGQDVEQPETILDKSEQNDIADGEYMRMQMITHSLLVPGNARRSQASE